MMFISHLRTMSYGWVGQRKKTQSWSLQQIRDSDDESIQSHIFD